jgi:Rad3-related DNA helicase
MTTVNETLFDLISPADLGLPSKFNRFRLAQREALNWLDQNCACQVSAALLPTGAGKTALAAAYARHLGVKAVYLVATKALQAQVLNDFEPMGMVDARGKSNYTCPNYGNCEAGNDEECSLKGTVLCPSTMAVSKAMASRLVVTNYAFWLWSNKYNAHIWDGVGLLVCDEAHAIESQLAGFASVKVYARELRGYEPAANHGLMPDDSLTAWSHRIVDALSDSDDKDEKDLFDRAKRIARMQGNWCWQFDDRGHATFEPIRLTGFTAGLFHGVPRVLLMSASLNEFTLRLLVPPDVEYDYRAWGQVFNPANAPVYHLPTRKLSWKSTDEDYKAVIEAADAIIDQRLDRKGIIHTVSYARSRRALEYSRHKSRFIRNEGSGDLSACLLRFRNAAAGSLLVTPSVAAGFDFPGSDAEYQIVLKFPFPNETQRVVKERCSQIPGYRLWSAAQEIVQMAGRARRYEQDRCETFILDNAVAQLQGPAGRSFCPPGFRIFTVTQVPPAPPKIASS